MIDDLFNVTKIFFFKFECIFWTGSDTGTAGDAFEWFNANITFSHSSYRAEAHACLAADTDVFVENHDTMFIA